MRISLRGTFWTLICTLAALMLTPQGHAQDDTNAANIPGTGGVWARSMHQVMGGTSLTVSSSTIRGPAGIYANVMLSQKINWAVDLACPSGGGRFHVCLNEPLVDTYLTNYFLYLLKNPAVSGLFLQAQWQDLSPQDPGDPLNASLLRLDYIDAALNAISQWNKKNPASPKTLQLDVTPGFNSPAWLFKKIDSESGGTCDPLFYNPQGAAKSNCGYTNIFYRTENKPVCQSPLPLPWNPTYKSYWKAFLQALNEHIGSNPSFVSIGVGGRQPLRLKSFFPMTVPAMPAC
jgi:hypothetical protein